MSEAIQPDYVEPNMQHIRNRYLQHYFEEVGDFKQAYYYQMENQRIEDSTRNERIKMRTAEIDLKDALPVDVCLHLYFGARCFCLHVQQETAFPAANEKSEYDCHFAYGEYP